ncbi:MAG: hypothetical protein ABR600_14365 [Actinomycetota bacterium]
MTAVVTAGGAALAVRLPQLGAWNARDLGALALLVAATIAGEQLHVAVRFGHQTKHVTVTEAAFAAALLLGVRASVLTLAVGIGVAAVYGARRVAPYKAAFNVGSYLAAVTAAELVFAAVRPAGMLMAIVPAMLAFFAVNASTVVGVIALSEGRSFLSVFAPIAHLEVGHTAVNLAAGVLLANVWLIVPVALPVLAAIPPAALAAYRMLLRRRPQHHAALA